MGKRRDTHEADYRLYARPEAGGSGGWAGQAGSTEAGTWADDDGGTAADAGARGLRRHSTGAMPAAAGVGRVSGETVREEDPRGSGEESPGFLPAGAPDSRRVNPYLCGAWAVVALMLGVGLLWFFGSLQMDSLYGVNTQVMTRKSMVMVNFQMMGPNLLPFGLAGAFALLGIHALNYERSRSRRD